ncbi:MAG: glycosyltransferase family 39 protein [Chloroflexi bacterium]|nr:glycosyltransferase family 39 protein [Chloroflexota bacterium]
MNDLLWRHLKSVPAFRALLRAVEARFYRHIELPEPVLDLGCGDGHFAQMAFDRPLAAGVDPWWGPLQKARRSGAYQLAVQSLGEQMPFSDGAFGSIVSNSVLEHIPNVQAVLYEASRVLRPGGRLVMTMPAQTFTQQLGGAEFLERLRLKGLADGYRRFFNAIARHAHTDPPEQWAARLAQAGLAVERWQYYFSREALHALEWGHVQGVPSAMLHFLTGHWILAPWESNLRSAERWLRPFYEEEPPEIGTMLLFIARKQGNRPIAAALPPARPIEIRPEDEWWELAGNGEGVVALAAPEAAMREETAVEPLDLSDYAEAPAARPARPWLLPKFGPALANGGLTLLALFGALLGQSILRSAEEPQTAAPWFGLSLAALLGLGLHAGRGWLATVTLPDFRAVPRQRWLVLLGFLLVLLANGQVNNEGAVQRPSLAIYLWLLAAGLAFYGLWDGQPLEPSPIPRPGWERLAVAGLFVLALVIRVASLTSHPFILNGTEASLGLDAWAVANGQLRNPFATGWLTNPTLPLFVMAVPLQLLGRSVLAIRLLSPLAGALAVPAIYLTGRRLWGPAVGLAAALLLAGSHLHVHYSRLGMTNIWDPLLVLAALGLLYTAWQSRNRLAWLLAGVSAGLNAYFYTSSHLFPLMLAGLLLFLLLMEREELWAQRRHLLAAAAVALVVALPQILFYRDEPLLFMDRANSLGIFQSGWFLQESSRTGLNAAQVLTLQFWRGLLAFNYGQDTSPAYNPGLTLLSFWPAVLLALGVGLALGRARQLRYVLLLLWLGVTLFFAAILLENPPYSHRLVIATPAVYLLIALALVWLGQRLLNAFNVQWRYGLPVILALAGLLALSDLVFYFGTYQAQHRFGDRNTEIAAGIADYLNALDGRWTAYFHGPPSMYSGFPTFPFLVETDVSLVDVIETDNPSPAGGNSVYLFLPERSAEIDQVRSLYPNGRLLTFPGFHADPLFYAYEVR